MRHKKTSTPPPAELIDFSQRYHCAPLAPLGGGQHTVWRIRYGLRQAVIKIRRAEFGRRLAKEALWLERGKMLGIDTPELLAHIQNDAYHDHLKLSPPPRGGKEPLRLSPPLPFINKPCLRDGDHCASTRPAG